MIELSNAVINIQSFYPDLSGEMTTYVIKFNVFGAGVLPEK